MPVVLVAPTDALPAWGPLTAPYAQTQALLRSPVLGWSFHLPQGLPEGLAFLLARANPALAGQTVLQGPLLRQDRATLNAVAAAGWLTQAPQVWLSVSDEAAETDIVPGFQALTTIQSSVNPTAALEAVVPLPPGTDPVLVRWVILLHEAGHTERGQLAQPIRLPGWPEAAVRALNGVVFDSGDLMGTVRDRFDEAFADAFAARVLLQLTHQSPQARQAIAYLALLRDTQAAQRPEDDDHGDGAVLRAILAEAPLTQTPAEVRRAAQADAGRPVLALLEQAHPLLGWAQQAQDTSWAAYRVRDYLEARQAAYVWHGPARGAAARAGQSPLLQALAREDARWAAQFEQQVSAAARERYRAYLAEHPPGGRFVEGGADPSHDDPAFGAWLDRATAEVMDRHGALLGADQAHFVAQAQQIQAQLSAMRVTQTLPVRARRRP